MHTRKQIDLRVQRAQLIELASIRTDLLFRDESADFACFNLDAVFMSLLFCFSLGSIIFPVQILGYFFYHLIGDFIDGVIAFQLSFDGNCFLDALFAMLINISTDIRIDRVEHDFHLRLCAGSDDFFFNLAQLADRIMADLQGFEHLVFRDFLRPRLNHVDGFFRAGNRQAQGCTFRLLHRRVDDIFAIYLADDDPGNRSVERNIRNTESQRRAEHCGHFRAAVRLNGKHRIDDLNFVAESFRKQRTDRAVDQTCGQRCMFRRTAFPAQKALRDLSFGIELLIIEHRQREEIFCFDFRAGCCGGKNHRIVVADQNRSAGLLCHLTIFNSDGAAMKIPTLLVLLHLFSYQYFLFIYL